MAASNEFITHLMGFGLTEKEALCYFNLLKYGPKTPSSLAKSLYTYREDVYRTLQSLTDRGMVRSSLDSRIIYSAIDLDTALESALEQYKNELLEMEQKKQELEKLSQQQRFSPSDEVATFKVIKTIGELVVLTLNALASTSEGFVFVVPEEMVVLASQAGINAEAARLVKEGKYVRGITDITPRVARPTQELIGIREDVRHWPDYRGVYFAVLDNAISFSAVNVSVKSIALSEPITVLWTDDTTYATYLVSTFELLWRQSVPAEERIRELLAKKALGRIDTQSFHSV